MKLIVYTSFYRAIILLELMTIPGIANTLQGNKAEIIV